MTFGARTGNDQPSRTSFNRRFSIASFGLLAPPSSHSRTERVTTVCVTLGFLTSIAREAAGPGGQSCSRNDLSARTAAS